MGRDVSPSRSCKRMAACVNHPYVEAGTACAGCERPFCPSCVVEFLSQPHCGACRDWKVAQMQGQRQHPAAAAASRVFSPVRRQGTGAVVGNVMMALCILPMIVAIIVANAAGPGLPASIALGLGTVAGVGGGMFTLRYLGHLPNGKLRIDLARKMEACGVPQAEQGAFIGLSPEAERRVYDSVTDWDIGFLLLGPGWLACYGDQVSFALRPEQVVSTVIPDRTDGFWYSAPRLHVHWQDAATGRQGVLNISSREAKTPADYRRRLEELRKSIDTWRAQPGFAGAIDLPLPPIEAQGGISLRQDLLKPGALFGFFMILFFFPVLGMLWFGMFGARYGYLLPLPLALIIGASFVSTLAATRQR